MCFSTFYLKNWNISFWLQMLNLGSGVDMALITSSNQNVKQNSKRSSETTHTALRTVIESKSDDNSRYVLGKFYAPSTLLWKNQVVSTGKSQSVLNCSHGSKFNCSDWFWRKLFHLFIKYKGHSDTQHVSLSHTSLTDPVIHNRFI